ncbi:MAG: GNAT family N-acetyltransferase [Pseudomonadota bacterium]
MLSAIKDQHLDAVLQLNNDHAQETSELDHAGLRGLVEASFLALQVEEGAGGFLLAVNQDALYDSPNFLWFRERYERFIYVDRIIVSSDQRGKGYARRFYEALFEKARMAGYAMVTCEVNISPPNPASDAFHQQMGFIDVGQAELLEREKKVRYLIKTIDPSTP